MGTILSICNTFLNDVNIFKKKTESNTFIYPAISLKVVFLHGYIYTSPGSFKSPQISGEMWP